MCVLLKSHDSVCILTICQHSTHVLLPCKHTHAHTHANTTAKQSDWALKLVVDIARREGLRSLMKGLGPRLIAVPSYMSVFYVVNEELEWLLLSKRLTN